MNAFEKVIQIVLKGIGIASGFLPLVQQAVPSSAQSAVKDITDDLTKAAGAVQTAAVVATALQGAGTTPSNIVAAAQPLVAQIVQQAEILAGKKITNEAQFTAGVQELTSGLHQILSSLGE